MQASRRLPGGSVVHRAGGVWVRRLGPGLVLHFLLLAALKLDRGRAGEILWISHAALLLGGVGLLIGSRNLVATAFTSVAVFHALWLTDAASGLALGWFPLGLTRYLLDCDAFTLAATSHHIYLAPALGWWLARQGGFTRAICLPAAALLLFVTLLSRLSIPPNLNVNFAHAVLPQSSHPGLVWMNRQPAAVFLAVHTLACFFGAMLPAHVLMQFVVAARQPRTTPTGELAPCPGSSPAPSR